MTSADFWQSEGLSDTDELYRRFHTRCDRKPTMADTRRPALWKLVLYLGPQNDKTFLITGGNSGTGFEATRILLAHGCKGRDANRSTQRLRTRWRG